MSLNKINSTTKFLKHREGNIIVRFKSPIDPMSIETQIEIYFK